MNVHKIWKYVFPVAVSLFLVACDDSSTGYEDSSVNGSSDTKVLSSDSAEPLSSDSVKQKSSDSAEPESSADEESDNIEESSGSKPDSGSSMKFNPTAGSVYDAAANTLKDLRDGQVYRTVTIEIHDEARGVNYSEIWMQENLNFDTGEFSSCYEYMPDNCDPLGRLYTWADAVGKTEEECGEEKMCNLPAGDIRGACPKGWHLPSEAEFNALVVAVDTSITEDTPLYSVLNKAGPILMSVSEWNGGITNHYLDTYSFTVLPSGYRENEEYFSYLGNKTHFWSSTEEDENTAISIGFINGLEVAPVGWDKKHYGYSVRCLKD